MNIFKKFTNFLREVKIELSKVSWSTRQELMGSTFVVIVVTFIMALFIGLFDLSFTRILSLVFR
ncbi:MAG: preprotein translocase subunit SecE [Candidatus Omnitrophica bacterium]|nr:preprotein translocase subunit SecE [Candidatus Omnitrophota bacterium]MBU4345885.1 preprotein translocase subunit SecE [Candidatus Omnitrophota bacterium]MBU4473058.1 preprotein translocase subunit SecE [Candidatus Omnitrophota bacterium]MCG2706651.1 preprotein translocase subunit SecE [Candidatus Omnitrophota bacterium]